MKPLVVIDNKGPNSGSHADLQKYLLENDSIETVINELDVGDVYFVTESGLMVGIEYKTVPDFLSSWSHKSGTKWVPGRLRRQLRNLKLNRDISILLLSGALETDYDYNIILRWSKSDGKKFPISSGWTLKQLMGLFMMLFTRGIYVPPLVKNSKEAAEIIATWTRTLNHKSQSSLFSPTIPVATPSIDPERDGMIAALMCIPGVGEKTANDILNNFRSWYDISLGEIKDFNNIKGVGLVTARKIYNWIRNI